MLKKIKKVVNGVSRLAAGAGLAGVILFGSFIQPGLHNSYLRNSVGNSTVKVMTSDQGGGSGFAVKAASGKEYIMTNSHVCRAASKNWVQIKSDKGLSVWKRIVYIDVRHDICLVEGDSRLTPLDLGSEPEKGDFFYIVGHPGLRQLTVSQGEYIGFGNVTLLDPSPKTRAQCTGEVLELSPFQQMFMGVEWVCLKKYRSYSTTAVAYGGNSGSPVVDKYGNVIGVLFAGSPEQERDNYVVPLYEVKRVLGKF